MPRYHFGQRRYVLGHGRWEAPRYKCANHEQGCTEKVDRVDTTCWPCTMAELNAKKSARNDEPKGAA